MARSVYSTHETVRDSDGRLAGGVHCVALERIASEKVNRRQELAFASEGMFFCLVMEMRSAPEGG